MNENERPIIGLDPAAKVTAIVGNRQQGKSADSAERFAKRVLSGIAAGFGLSYDVLARDYDNMECSGMTPRVRALLLSGDRRRRRRGMRLYLKQNGARGSLTQVRLVIAQGMEDRQRERWFKALSGLTFEPNEWKGPGRR